MVVENGKRIVRLMRYLCRPAGKPVFYDQKFPGCYNVSSQRTHVDLTAPW